MMEYRKSLWVALTNLLAFAVAILLLFLSNLLENYGIDDDVQVDMDPRNRIAIFFLVTVMVFHWWKHRKKYKGLTKVKALLGILFTGVINLLLCGVTYGVTIYFFPGGEKRAVVGKIVLGMIGWALSGVISDLLWQVIWKQQSRVNLK